MFRPLILISNDDGYKSKGISELVRMICHLGDIIVCAPEEVQSGKSRAFTMTELTVRKIKEQKNVQGTECWYACSGTPVDCTKVAINKLCPRKPDLVIGGINHGDNASTNTHYSGTTGIAFEGTVKRIPSIAFSLCDYSPEADFSCMEEHVVAICKYVLENGLPEYTFLNVNCPKATSESEIKGLRVCRMAHGEWMKEVVESDSADSLSPSSIEVDNSLYGRYLLRGYYLNNEPERTDTDNWAISNGFLAVTPTTIDITAFDFLDTLSMSLCDVHVLGNNT